MPTTNSPSPPAILIAGITPYFLERGALWFREHAKEIRERAAREAWWRDRTVFLGEGDTLAYSPFLRKLADMGYAKVALVERRGEFAARGGIVDVFAINREDRLRIEFSGNAIERILSLPPDTESKPLKLPEAKTASAHERLWLAGLAPGDCMVHVDHGIGVFRGFAAQDRIPNSKPETRNKLQSRNAKFQKDLNVKTLNLDLEFYVLEYAPARRGGMPDTLYVPRAQAPKLSRYVGFDTPAIHRLGGTSWAHTKRRAKEEARMFAEELLAVIRTRAGSRRPPYPDHPEIERRLAQSFPYEETADQTRAIAEIHESLSMERPMDRLLLGDVGFGKTEVAIRAAARVAWSGKQVALLAPTTVLADQHFATFRERLAGLPIEIASLTRLTPKREEKKEIEKLKDGKTDIVIGTHRLFSRDIAWRNLGLVVIDEEQRFGVRHKESFKKLRSEVDILSLSATPIPRTLSLALAEFRDLSIIQSPPPGRLPIQTVVVPYSERIVGEVVAAARGRGDQVFYLWNRIETIESARRNLQRLAPGSRIAVLHGRMPEGEIIRTMHELREGRVDILLATTIIENGLDLPSVNTLVVANAARLGLGQAYQIRGRIGRGDQPAYAYFLYPVRSLTEKGRARLRTLKEIEGLGGGFQIALRDLEIRGAGNVLGKQQSGTMNRVGLNLYAHMLGEALEELG